MVTDKVALLSARISGATCVTSILLTHTINFSLLGSRRPRTRSGRDRLAGIRPWADPRLGPSCRSFRSSGYRCCADIWGWTIEHIDCD